MLLDTTPVRTQISHDLESIDKIAHEPELNILISNYKECYSLFKGNQCKVTSIKVYKIENPNTFAFTSNKYHYPYIEFRVNKSTSITSVFHAACNYWVQ
jgi:hypothetical protein